MEIKKGDPLRASLETVSLLTFVFVLFSAIGFYFFEEVGLLFGMCIGGLFGFLVGQIRLKLFYFRINTKM